MIGSDISLDEKIERFVDAYHTRLAKHPYLLGYVIGEAARTARKAARTFKIVELHW